MMFKKWNGWDRVRLVISGLLALWIWACWQEFSESYVSTAGHEPNLGAGILMWLIFDVPACAAVYLVQWVCAGFTAMKEQQ